MDAMVPSKYKEYGEYINSFRSFPLDIDGLKPVERRILLTAYDVARNKMVKSAKLDGHCIANYHPHSSVYGTIVQLKNQGFLEGQGNFGSDVGVESCGPAAMRYTECGLARRTLNMAFELINYVPWVESELDNEPLFLPTLFPFCLLGKNYTEGIGFGYKTVIPCYEYDDLKKRLMWLLEIEKEKPILKPITDCKILSSDDDLEVLASTGAGKIEFQGIYEIDNVNHKVIIKSWPPGKTFNSILSKLSKMLLNLDIGFSDLSKENTKIVFEVLKQRNKLEIFNEMKDLIDEALKGQVHFEIIVVDVQRQVKTASIDYLLLKTYNLYKVVTNEKLQDDKIKSFNLMEELKNLEKLKPHLSKHLTSKKTTEEIINDISKDSKIESEKIKEIFGKYRINKLLTVKTDTSEIEENIKKIDETIEKIDEYIIQKYQTI